MTGARAMMDSHRRRGQGLVEATMVLLVFFALLLGVVDCGQVLFAHQAMVERVRSAVRWGALHPFDGTGEQVANLILYDQLDEPGVSREGFLGLTRANVQVRYQPASEERPDDEMLSVAILNYESHFFSPWIARNIVSPRPVVVSAPIAARCADSSVEPQERQAGEPGTRLASPPRVKTSAEKPGAHRESGCAAGR